MSLYSNKERVASPTSDVDNMALKEPETSNKNVAIGKQIIIVRSSKPSTESQQRMSRIEPEKDSLCPSVRFGKGFNFHYLYVNID